MAVKRIVANVRAERLAAAHGFYAGILGMRVAMDHGWIVTFAGEGDAVPQVSIATEGGSGTPVPDLSVEVDDFEAVRGRIEAAGLAIVHGPVDEPWGVRRLFVHDPFGRLVNILTHG